MSKCRIPNKHIFQRVSTEVAFRILEKRKLLDEELGYIGSSSTSICTATTPRILLTQCNCCLARDIGPIRFLGGPPNATKWYEGSLLTFILDAIFQDRAEEARCGSNT